MSIYWGDMAFNYTINPTEQSCQVLNEQLLDEQLSNEAKNITLYVHSTSAEFLDGISGVDNHMHYNTTLL